MKITKQFLKDEAFEFKKHLQEKWQPENGKNLREHLEDIDSRMNSVEDFVTYLIERNFKH